MVLMQQSDRYYQWTYYKCIIHCTGTFVSYVQLQNNDLTIVPKEIFCFCLFCHNYQRFINCHQWFVKQMCSIIMYQSFDPPPPPPPHIHSVRVWKPVKFPDTRAKILSEVPASWYSAVQTKVPCVELAVTAFLKSSHQTLKSISKRRKCECKLRK